jgi:hypothetical protein
MYSAKDVNPTEQITTATIAEKAMIFLNIINPPKRLYNLVHFNKNILSFSKTFVNMYIFYKLYFLFEIKNKI